MPLVGNVSRAWIEAANKKNALCDRSAYISMTDPESKDPQIDVPNLLRLKFWDVDKEWQGREPASQSQIDQIANFLLKHRGKDIIAHCEVGMCRSGAVTQAVLDMFPEYIQMHNDRIPNSHVLTGIKTAINRIQQGV